MFKLYKLTFSSNKSYIGQTTRKMQTRLLQHANSARTGSMLAVHCAWRMYGEPVVELIGDYSSQEELHAAEISAIVSHKTLSPHGYNIGFGGETAPSKNPEVAAKISAKGKGRKYSDTSSFSAAVKAKWLLPEYREKMTKSLKAAWTPEMREARSKKAKEFWDKRRAAGWQMPQSQKDKLAARVISKEWRANMSIAAKGKPKAARSDVTRKKISENTKEFWSNKQNSENRACSIKSAWTPEKRAAMAAKAAATWRNPEVRAKRLAAMNQSKGAK